MDTYTTFTITPKLQKRFWAKVRKAGANVCWEWQASKFKGRGYGTFVVEGRLWSAHRVSYVLAHGSIPKGLYICHTCDNQGCVNPAHLYAGTHDDNTRDAIERGRNPKGQKHGMAKFSEETLQQVRDLTEQGISERQVAAMLGVSSSQVHRIKLAAGIAAPEQRQRPVKLTLDDAREIRRLRNNGVRGSDIAIKFGISQALVCDIVKNRAWKEG